MPARIAWLAPVLAAALLGGCATMSENECRTADWRDVGYRDGKAGYPRSRMAEHADACKKVGVTVDPQAYDTGRVRGLNQYCTPENGLDQGLHGGSYRNVCPPNFEPGFLRNYRAGREVYDQRNLVDSLDSDRSRLETKLDKADSDDERKRIRNQLHELDYRLRTERDILYIKENAARGGVQ